VETMRAENLKTAFNCSVRKSVFWIGSIRIGILRLLH